MRLIDADDLLIELGSYHVGGIEAIINYDERRHRNEWTEGLHTAWRTIDDAPTIDAMPVVRCKDCKYCSVDRYTDGNVPDYVCIEMDCGVKADDFCSSGERKDG